MAVSRGESERFVYLVAGFDDAAENTDVLSEELKEKSISVRMGIYSIANIAHIYIFEVYFILLYLRPRQRIYSLR